MPSDLTALSKGNGGNFPEDEVGQVVDGRKRLPDHSDWDTDTPLWGMQFQEQGKKFTPGSEAKVNAESRHWWHTSDRSSASKSKSQKMFYPLICFHWKWPSCVGGHGDCLSTRGW